MASSRLLPRIQHRIVRFACELPARSQRALFGAPPRIDGQELAMDIQALLLLAPLAIKQMPLRHLSPLEARAQLRGDIAVVAGPQQSPPAGMNIAIPGPAGMIPARLYEPPGPGIERRPLLVYFHGGYWALGDLDTHDGICRFLARNAAVAVLAVEYRLAPEHPFPAAIEDALAAYRWASERHARLGVDPARIGVGGDSVGGNLAAAVSRLTRDEGIASPAMQALVYPVVDATARA